MRPNHNSRVLTRTIFAAAAVVLATACGSAVPPPSVQASDPLVVDSGPPDPTAVVQAQLSGKWRRSPILLGDPQIAVISDACASAAREKLGEAEANLPTAVVDARGEGLATAILSDDDLAVVCVAKVDDAGTVTVDAVDRLAADSFDRVDQARIGVTEIARADDRPGGRTIAFGRVGPEAAAVKLGFDDASTVQATNANDWWAAWWPKAPRASAIAAVDRSSVVIGSADAPKGTLENRLGRASWWIDPAAEAPTAASTTVHGLVLEGSCASGSSPKGRIQHPVISESDAAVTVTFGVLHKPGGQDCQSNPPFAVTFQLPSPLGDRTLLDGSEVPPREATKPAG